MNPVLGREFVERQQQVAVFLQAVASLSVLRWVFLDERIGRFLRIILRLGLPDFMKVAFGFGLNAPRQLVQNVGRFVTPAALPLHFRERFADRRPETEGTVTDGDPRGLLQAALHQVNQQLTLALFAFAINVQHGNQFLLTICASRP
nr:hypothetical protein [Crateriforma conspicua]